MTYWDPVPTVRAMVGEPLPLWKGDLVTDDWSRPAPDIENGLAEYLRGYVFWLAEGRPAGPGESLPGL